MENPSSTSPGFLHSIHTLAASLLATVEDRIELVSVELQEEKHRLIQTFIWISAAIFTGFMAIAFASLTIVYLLWESARLYALGGLTLLYTAALVAIIVAFRRFIARQPKPFAATLSEIKLDRSHVSGR
ncbi:MAG: phage holin family protein [Opitutaceae bacterium]